MKARKILVICVVIIAAALIGATSGLAYMRETYGSMCSPLDGFPGLLQKANLFAPSANCGTTGKGNKTCVSPGALCTIKNPPSGFTTTGHCAQTPTGCLCQ